MHTARRLPDRIERLAAVTAWLLAVLGWLAAVADRIGVVRRSARMKRTLNLCERITERVLVLKAVRELGRPVRACAPSLPPRGFRLRRGGYRGLLRFARVRARGESIRSRIEILRCALRAPQAIARRMARSLAKGWRYFHVVAAAPAPALFHNAPRPAPDAADTS